MNIKDVLANAGIDCKETLRRFGGNEALFERFARKFPEDDTFRLLLNAVNEGDGEEILRQAHTLKGTSANLGFQQLSVCCAELVSALRAGQPDRTRELFEGIRQEYEKVVRLISKID